MQGGDETIKREGRNRGKVAEFYFGGGDVVFRPIVSSNFKDRQKSHDLLGRYDRGADNS